jgi:Domain of unknown function (DUF4157)
MGSYERHPEEASEHQHVEQAAPEQAQSDLSPAERLASTVGNQAFGALARQGAGILPDGRAHPDVESTIARTRGSGNTLDGGTRERIGAGLGDPLSDVRVHTDDTADQLTSSVSARAFTTGSDVYFAKGEYSPGSSAGDQLLAHELSHVVQQRGAPTSGPLQVSQPGDALEVEADAAATQILG